MLAAAAAVLVAGGCASRRPAPAGPQSAAAGPYPSAAVAPPSPSGSGAESGFAQPGSAQAAALVSQFAQAAGERVYFAFDSHALDAQARATLDAQADWLRGRPAIRVLVAGHADERGTREYNLALGSRRAQAARDYLASRGVEGGRIDTISYGKERPVDSRSNEDGWARNRNAHSVLVDLIGGY